MSTEVMKTRREFAPQGKAVYGLHSGPSWGPAGPQEISCVHRAFQETHTSGHRWPPVKGDEALDIGGSFMTRKIYCVGDHEPLEPAEVIRDFVSQKVTARHTKKLIPLSTPAYLKVDSNPAHTGTWYSADGPLFAWANSYSAPNSDLLIPSTNAEMVSYGSSMMAKALPTNSLSNLGQFILELREGLPSIPALLALKDKARYFNDLSRSGGKEYLNLQFGWVPFVNDILDVVRVSAEAHKHLSQFQRDSGKLVRRRFTAPPIVTTAVTNLGNSYGVPGYPIQCFTSPGKLMRSVKTVTVRRFSGAFTYWLPPIYKEDARLQALWNKLYGTKLTPELIYKVFPWSWLLDWCTNVGDVLHNWCAFNDDNVNLVVKYAYAMEHIQRVTSYSISGITLKDGRKINTTQDFVSEVKSRIRATPYGFGLNPSTFTAKQWAILTALGITRRPRSLNES